MGNGGGNGGGPVNETGAPRLEDERAGVPNGPAAAIPGSALDVEHPPPRTGTVDEPARSVDVTSEIRWFVDGGLPPEVRRWFSQGGSTGLGEVRRDIYRIDGQVDIGVKRRFTTVLELKLRMEAPRVIEVHPGIVGRLERWQRWSPAEGLVHLHDAAAWLAVDKAIVKRRTGADGREVPLTPETRAMTGDGCDAEVASVSVGERQAWTLALAAFGDGHDHGRTLELAWERVADGRPGPNRLRLDHANSCGYPEWLAGIVGRARDGGRSAAGIRLTEQGRAATRGWGPGRRGRGVGAAAPATGPARGTERLPRRARPRW